MSDDAYSATDVLQQSPLLIGMVHLGPTPGAPAHDGTTGWLDRAVEDAAALVEAGFGAVLVENFGDKPFFAGRVPPETVAAVTHAAARVRERLPAGTALGINVLRNDAEAALAVAAAVGADFIRVNVLAGAAVTDQGVIEGRAADVVRMRARLAPSVRIFADLRVKHARPLVERSLAGEARELVERAGADAVIVSGSATGRPVDMGKLAAVRSAVGSHPVLVGSGATVESMGDLLEHADGVIVGTAIKAGGVTTAPVDVERARAFVMAGRIGRRGA